MAGRPGSRPRARRAATSPDGPVARHRRQARIAAAVKVGAGRGENHSAPGPGAERRCRRRLPVAQGAAAGGEHRQGAHQPLAIPRRDARGRPGIDPGEALAERGLAQGVEGRPRRGFDVRRDRGDVRQALGQGAKIEPRAADHDGEVSPAGDVRQHRARRRQPSSRRPAVGRVGDAIEVVRRAGLIRRRRPRREHAKVAVDLHGVGIDDLAAGLPRPGAGPGPTCRSRWARRSARCAAGSHRGGTLLRWCRHGARLAGSTPPRGEGRGGSWE